MNTDKSKVISFILIVTAFIILLFNTGGATNKSNIPDITIKYGNLFFILSGIYSLQWMATDNNQKGWVILISASIQIFVALLHFYEHNLHISTNNT